MLKIEFYVSKQAALLAGLDADGAQLLYVRPSELTEAERATAAKLMQNPSPRPKDGADFVLPYHTGASADDTGKRWAVATLETVKEALADAERTMGNRAVREAAAEAKKAAEARAEKEEYEAAVQEVLAAGTAALIEPNGDRGLLYAKGEYLIRPYGVRKDPRVVALLAEAEAQAEANNAPIIAVIQREREAEAAKKAAAEKAVADQKLAWLAAHGSESMRARAERGLLSEQDLLDAMRDFYMAPLDGFEKYVKLRSSDVETHSEVTFSTNVATTVGEEEFATLVAIEEAAKAIDGTVACAVWNHGAYAHDDDDAESEYRSSVRVEVKVGDLTFSRRYACPQPV